ncbi:kinase-like domain-containing protein [Baffinella frigidus]|nr:kinase-like domain-containing protein [Cryptophyta sp. CCMP2293]|mmetsp:Transcript_16166/g.37894  ORF Transcript_16166/g.37894 Transcript_16166/m.37894 type:complete len:457 (+) Transcript_16166:56-1426(+)|eukprot:CAMPEP_0180159580 /NCGR_PEP_ID=MMETSP0986-20121125/27601_1 /TAXON_ID=697907 /ORGANISM="non described non described, Strain CCMP2293" /LENGTH=456 /DNA_ID=CAMNT_0022109677 /DNA_START=32 /DNA_END=1402 /DNA_ORIENTATION=+
MPMAHDAAPLPGGDMDDSLLAICRRDMRGRSQLSPAPEEEKAFSPSRWEGGCFLEDDDNEDFKHAAEELLGMGVVQSAWIMKLGELELGRQIGQGSAGAVYKGMHIPSGRAVAVKGIRADLTERTRKTNHTLQDFVYEIDLLSKIGQHPNILGFVGANIDTPDAPIIVLEYMDGGCVEDVLTAKSKNGSPWCPPKATSYSWCAQLCAALSFLHDRETPLVHRDIKASNLLCSADLTTIKLGDFGLCRPVKTLQEGNDNRVMTGMTGTFTHMAPEVFTATAGYSEKADIFSGAVCMVNLISGDHAYAAETVWCKSRPELLARRVALEGYRPSLERKIKNTDMQDLLTRMWAQEPSKRPTAAECEVELEALLATVTSRSRKPLAVIKRAFFSGPTASSEGVQDVPRRSNTGQFFKRVFRRVHSDDFSNGSNGFNTSGLLQLVEHDSDGNFDLRRALSS